MTQRAREVSWVLHHLEDLDADFTRFYRCDWESLTGPRFFTRAQRVSAYGGVMTSIVQEAIRAEEEPEGEDTLPALPSGAVVVPESAMADLIQ